MLAELEERGETGGVSTKPKIEIARIYDVRDTPSRESVTRVLVDRLWPRGVSREDASIDSWPKEATPSTELRKSWHADPHGHEPERFNAFKEAYRDEFKKDPAKSALAELVEELSDAKSILLLTAAKDPDVSHVPVIAEALRRRLK